jgi:hypothetical protein
MRRNPIIPSALVLVVALSLAASPAVASAVASAARSHADVTGMSSFNAVACPTSTRCVAVGSDNSGNGYGRAATLDVASATGSAGAGRLSNNTLFSVACGIPTICVGAAENATVRVDVATGAIALVTTLHAPSGSITSMDDIACPNSSECFGVGFQGPLSAAKGLLARFTETGSLVAETHVATASGLGGIACPTTTQCIVSVADRSNPEKIELLQNGHLGTAHTLPAGIYVQRLACYKATNCYALAGKVAKGTERTDLVYDINPVTGAIGARHVIAGGFSGTGIACPTSTHCIVVGDVGIKPAVDTLTLGAPNAPRLLGSVSLSGVACASPTNVCIGVGQNGSFAALEKV